MEADMDLIRGVSGFVGSALRKDLEIQGRKVGIIDRNLNIPKDDIDVVYYSAAYGNLYGQNIKSLIHKVCCEDVNTLLRRLQGNFGLFVYLSTSSVYGNKQHPMYEEMKLTGSTAYARAKIEGEKVVRRYAQKQNCVVIRPFSITGVGEQDIHLIPSAIKAAREDLVLNLDPDPVHDFIDIDDLLSGIELIVQYHLEWGHGPLEIYNLGSGKQWRNDQVIEIIEQETQTDIRKKVVHRQRNYDSDYLWQANIDKMKKLGWYPKKPLDESIREMIVAYDQRNK